jgi:hypothetical protein
MTYVSTLRLSDPQYEANLLLQNTYALRNRILRSFIIALGVKYGSIAALMRYVWHSEDFCSAHQRDATIAIYAACVVKIESLQCNDLEGTLRELKVQKSVRLALHPDPNYNPNPHSNPNRNLNAQPNPYPKPL